MNSTSLIEEMADLEVLGDNMDINSDKLDVSVSVEVAAEIQHNEPSVEEWFERYFTDIYGNDNKYKSIPDANHYRVVGTISR